MKTIAIKDDVYNKLVAQKGKDESFSDLFERLVEESLHNGIDVAITAITMYEALYGLMKYSKPFHHLFSFHVYEFSSEDAKQSARLEIGLERMGKNIKRTNITIASTAINKGATLCTFDNEFEALEDFGLRRFR